MKKILSFVIILLLIGVTTSSITGFNLDYNPSSLLSPENSQHTNNNITGITPYEAWELLTNT